MTIIRIQTVLAAVAVLLLLSSVSVSAQVSVSADADGSLGRTFMGGADGSSAARAAAHRWGTPRIDSRRSDSPRTVPINVNSLGNGTANAPVPPAPRPRRPETTPGLPATLVQVNNQITVVSPSDAGARRRAVRSADALRALERERARRAADGASAARTPRGAADAPARASVSPAPLVEPLIVPPRDEELDARNCVTLRITTPGGIEWRHEVALDVLGASSVAGAASLLQGKLRRGEPLVVRSSGGGFSVPAHLVDSLIVGPCR